ncbi:hypothetical protein JOF53_000983 [Crossiella equi]|uniref:IrrE N-terminal-like domain-containing protein n=1 Tax=Crossiella equi TaxID=130796 RepID=A0ABS5A686_9PSEU|nr:ImmA/IrrE family metallo-endopeptidase [Crossiella equi]MBP2472111.1 hypothetical protein [Crossiella equi]
MSGFANERHLRQHCRKLLRELRLTPPLDVHELVRRVSEQRGRPIELVAQRFSVPGPFGAWTSGQDTDQIHYQAETTATHQNHIILHELSHLLAGHEPTPEHALFRRTSYDSRAEYEAETIATIFLEWSAVARALQPRRSTGEPARRMADSLLGERVDWL